MGNLPQGAITKATLPIAFVKPQLNDCRNSKGESFVFVLNNLLNDCGCSKPNP